MGTGNHKDRRPKMANYTVHPIAVCRGPRDGSHFTYRANFGITINTACYAWYINGSSQKILVDTGATAAMFRERGAAEEDLISMTDGLAKLGITPEEIDLVILTHLHCDHIELAHLYKKAKFIVQKKELDYAHNPHPIDADFYIRNFFEGLNYDIIDGDKKIEPGLTVFLSPGHSPGGQSIEVKTASGQVVIPGFCCTGDTFRQTEDMKRRGWQVTIPLIHQDTREIYDSVIKIKKRADIILSLHGPEYIGVGKVG
jgi:glyoxylase-like metal-dependent hydrolase (beta-lactamase superfamily II)